MAAVTTDLVGEACRRHRTFPTASAALGRALTGGLLLGAAVKDLEKLTVHFACDGPIGSIVAQADAQANVRGYVSNPEADAPAENDRGKLDVRAVVGSGTLYVTRDAGFEIGLMKEPYRGMVPIVSGEIGEDFAYYLAKSEQVNSAVSLGVLMTVDANADVRRIERAVDLMAAEFELERLRVAAAGGFIVQVMPSADEQLIADLETILPRAPHATEMIRSGLGPTEMLQTVLGDLDLLVLEEKQPRFFCRCSHERALLIISALGREEVEDMLSRDHGAELVCHFCNQAYQISAEELSAILAEE
jgi:molecular chaperone Hsp33